METAFVWLLIKMALLAAGIKLLRHPVVKGWFGEWIVKIHLLRLDKQQYRIIHDVLIEFGNGVSAQIDHVVVSEYGVFVIETKNYTGLVRGHEDDNYWTQILYKRKERLYNPLRQNEMHVKRLKDLFQDMQDIPFVSIVAFTSRARFMIKTNQHLVQTWRLPFVIKSYKDKVINQEKAAVIYSRIIEKNVGGRDARKKHVKRIKSYRPQKAEGRCPRCGGGLVHRSGKNGGRFKGCSNFPKCRYTKSI